MGASASHSVEEHDDSALSAECRTNANSGDLHTSTKTMRLVYFRGHRDQQQSAMITRICKQYETVSGIMSGELAWRTLANLYNLVAVRGPLVPVHAASDRKQLVLNASMSGPHHYFGFLDPTLHYTIETDPETRLPVFRAHPGYAIERPALAPLDDEFIVRLCDYRWIEGKTISPELLQRYRIDCSDDDETLLNVEFGAVSRIRRQSSLSISGAAAPSATTATSSSEAPAETADSLFDYPGLLELPFSHLKMPLVTDPCRFDLSPYRAQVVRHAERPFAFDAELQRRFPHARHKLRVVTYHYGERYLPDYVMKGNGVFIERHDFIQCITPMSESCGGFVIVGREIERNDSDAVDASGDRQQQRQLELVAVRIPFGCTLLVDVQCIHGDSTLTGTYMMAMTGNHVAMGTADTVFLKCTETSSNVHVVASAPGAEVLDDEPAQNSLAAAMSAASGGAVEDGIGGCSTLQPQLLITSEQLSLRALHEADAALKAEIATNVARVGFLRSQLWRPVIATGTAAIGWDKTLGSSLPAPSIGDD
jgi:hypothetical protein